MMGCVITIIIIIISKGKPSSLTSQMFHILLILYVMTPPPKTNHLKLKAESIIRIYEMTVWVVIWEITVSWGGSSKSVNCSGELEPRPHPYDSWDIWWLMLRKEHLIMASVLSSTPKNNRSSLILIQSDTQNYKTTVSELSSPLVSFIEFDV